MDHPCEPFTIGCKRLVRRAFAILIDRGNMMRFDHERHKWPALPFAAADRERTQRDPVITLAPCDQISPLRLAALNKILPREFQRRFDCLGAAADNERMTQPPLR